jgi:lipopolysaccharide/colanic/teichoic acid biosynthesis glycosyltransferase
MTQTYSEIYLLPIYRRPLARAIKRMIDIFVAIFLVIFLAPILLTISVIIFLDLRASPLFIQDRIGLRQQRFKIFKFRTMRERPTVGPPKWDDAERSRVTPIGGFLRDFGIDELPQLWNIIIGDMSIIGPRPPLESELEWYPDDARIAFEMRPGVLSLAALMGRRSIPLAKRFSLHGRYVLEWSLKLDWRIFVGVARIVLLRRDVDESERF